MLSDYCANRAHENRAAGRGNGRQRLAGYGKYLPVGEYRACLAGHESDPQENRCRSCDIRRAGDCADFRMELHLAAEERVRQMVHALLQGCRMGNSAVGHSVLQGEGASLHPPERRDALPRKGVVQESDRRALVRGDDDAGVCDAQQRRVAVKGDQLHQEGFGALSLLHAPQDGTLVREACLLADP